MDPSGAKKKPLPTPPKKPNSTPVLDIPQQQRDINSSANNTPQSPHSLPISSPPKTTTISDDMKNLMFDVDSFLNEVDVSELENATTVKNVQRNRFNSSSPRSPNEFDSLILEEFLSGNTKETSPNKTIPTKGSPRSQVTTLNISNINKSSSEGSPRSLSPNSNNSPNSSNSSNKSVSEGSPRTLQTNNTNTNNNNNGNNRSPRDIESPRYSTINSSNEQFKLGTSATNRRGTGANANSLSPRDRRVTQNPSSEFATTRDRAREREARANNSNITITEPSLIGLNRNSDSIGGGELDKQKPSAQSLRRVSQQGLGRDGNQSPQRNSSSSSETASFRESDEFVASVINSDSISTNRIIRTSSSNLLDRDSKRHTKSILGKKKSKGRNSGIDVCVWKEKDT